MADGHVVADIDVLPKRAALANRRLCADVHPMPDAGAIADAGALIDDRGGVGFVCHAELAGVRRAAARTDALRPARPGRAWRCGSR